jgi:hypothetical protein
MVARENQNTIKVNDAVESRNPQCRHNSHASGIRDRKAMRTYSTAVDVEGDCRFIQESVRVYGASRATLRVARLPLLVARAVR